MEIKTLPKIRLFLWRAVSGALALTDRLQIREMNVELECKLCRNSAETINHVVFQCIPAQEMLKEVHFPTLSASNRYLCENMKVALETMIENTIPENLRRAIPWMKNICLGISWELRCSIWALQSLRDLGHHDIVIGLDNRNLMDAPTNGVAWPPIGPFWIQSQGSATTSTV